MFPAAVAAAAADVLVTLFDEESRRRGAARWPRELRAPGCASRCIPEPDKLGKQFKYAAARGDPFVAVLGGDERARGEVTIKDMQTRAAGRRVARVGGRVRGSRPDESQDRRRPTAEQRQTMRSNRSELARTHTCGELRVDDVGKDVVLLGWVHRVRDLGSLVFIDIRDRHGITQVVVARQRRRSSPTPKRLRPEYVVAVLGQRRASLARDGEPEGRRPARSRSSAREIRLLNDAKTPPFPIADDAPVSEDTRLKYRYLDLRRAAHAAQHRSCATARRWRSGSISTSRASSRSRRRC